MKASENYAFYKKTASEIKKFLFENSSHIHFIVMFTISPGCHNQPRKTSKIKRNFHVAAFPEIFTKNLQALKESPDDSLKNFLTTTNF